MVLSVPNTRSVRRKSNSVSASVPKTATTSTDKLRELLNANRRGRGLGIYAVCSANRFVLEAAMLQARADRSLLLIEATSNQVNQFGGYTGQTPEQFVEFVHTIAAEMKFPLKQIILGGDHLGPHVWRNESGAAAMEKAKQMVRAYVHAGFCKIHLDASMACADDQVGSNRALVDEVVSARAAELCEAAERSHREMADTASPPLYVVGTEVPVPGGETAGSHAPEVTKTKDLARTLSVAEKAFVQRGLNEAWERVIAVVVQPGVEFGDSTVFAYNSNKANPLSRFITRAWNGVYEAHSTDYQTLAALRQLVLDHFAILKVGPWLTFAFREAVFGLASVEREWLSGKAGVSLSGLPEVLETAMLEHPHHWQNHYSGDERQVRIARRYSYSDRARYYWPQTSVASALQRLIDNLSEHTAPQSLLSQYMPSEAEALRSGAIANDPRAMIHHKILAVLEQYAFACGLRQ